MYESFTVVNLNAAVFTVPESSANCETGFEGSASTEILAVPIVISWPTVAVVSAAVADSAVVPVT